MKLFNLIDLTHYNNKTFIELYTLTHFTWGIIIGLIFRKFRPEEKCIYLVLFYSFFLGTLFEVLENTIGVQMYENTIEYEGDSMLNIISDILFIVIGAYLTYKLSTKVLIIIVIFIELLLLILMRDNIILITYQTFFYNQALAEWQSKALIKTVTPVSVGLLKRFGKNYSL